MGCSSGKDIIKDEWSHPNKNNATNGDGDRGNGVSGPNDVNAAFSLTLPAGPQWIPSRSADIKTTFIDTTNNGSGGGALPVRPSDINLDIRTSLSPLSLSITLYWKGRYDEADARVHDADYHEIQQPSVYYSSMNHQSANLSPNGRWILWRYNWNDDMRKEPVLHTSYHLESLSATSTETNITDFHDSSSSTSSWQPPKSHYLSLFGESFQLAAAMQRSIRRRQLYRQLQANNNSGSPLTGPPRPSHTSPTNVTIPEDAKEVWQMSWSQDIPNNRKRQPSANLIIEWVKDRHSVLSVSQPGRTSYWICPSRDADRHHWITSLTSLLSLALFGERIEGEATLMTGNAASGWPVVLTHLIFDYFDD
jgi:hypothetical protein